MEESEKRRERLKAMRMEAAQVANSHENPMGTSHGLSNPLIESYSSPRVQAGTSATPRFDYYTDPMSAFSADKRRSKVSHDASPKYYTPPRPRTPDVTPSPGYQGLTNYPHDQRTFQAQGMQYGFSPTGSPVGLVNHFGMTQGNSPGFWDGSSGPSSNYIPSVLSRGGNFGSPGSESGGSPIMNYGSSGPSSNYIPSGLSRGGNLCSPGSEFGGSPGINYGYGRGHLFSKSPHHVSGRGGSPRNDSGRGRGRWYSASPSSKLNSRRGLGSQNHLSAESRPDLFYSKSMVEDPWQMLKPVIWRREVAAKSLDTPDSRNSWLPTSIKMKRARASETNTNTSSQGSLAEYLAASFHEAVNNEGVKD